MKDPAFLFYSKDFYEGTRTMLPEERACYIDLMVYQHQNGSIPNDIDRILLYCSGITKHTLEAVLESKFEVIDDGWINRVLERTMNDRSEFAKKQSINGSVGQFWKKAKAILDKKQYQHLKDSLYEVTNIELYQKIEGKKIDKAMLIAMLKHIVNASAIEDVIVIEDCNTNSITTTNKEYIDKGGLGEKEYKQTFDEFRKAYPGTKRGLETEFKNFKKHTDYKNVVKELSPALAKLIEWRRASETKGNFVPQYPMLQTWINQRRWEEELEAVKGETTKKVFY